MRPPGLGFVLELGDNALLRRLVSAVDAGCRHARKFLYLDLHPLAQPLFPGSVGPLMA